MTSAPTLLWDPMDPAFQADPSSAWARLREAGAVVRLVPGVFALGRYADVLPGLSDPRLSRHMLHNPGIRAIHATLPPGSALARDFQDGLSQLDGESHAELRRVATVALAGQAAEDLVERAVERTRRWTRQPGSTCAVQTLFRPLTDAFLVDLFGVPGPDREAFSRDARRYVDSASGASAGEAAHRASERLEAVVARAARQGRGLASDLARALPMPRVQGLVRALLTAGIHPIANTLGMTLLAIATDERVREAFRTSPRRAIRELLRWRHVGRFVPRVAPRAVELHGVTVDAGSIVLLGIASAHLDPEVFPEPDRFDADRDLSRVRPFGTGPATCIAASLALSLGAAVGESLAGAPDLALAGDPVWAPDPYLRSLTALPVHRPPWRPSCLPES